MSSHKSIVHRALAFAPYTLPLWLISAVPYITPDQTARLVLYVASVFAIPMVLDLVGGADRSAAGSPDGRPRWEFTLLARLLFVKLIAIQAIMLLAVAHKGVHGVSLVIMGVVVGLFYGTLAIVLAHELMHRASRLDQFLAEALLTTVSYPHFCIEHVHGHHLKVATPDDPASARLGESLYAFLPRTIVGGLVSAWRIESGFLKRRRHGWWRHRMLRHAVMVAAWYGAAFAIARWDGVIVAAITGAVAIVSLELINYIQHYGLQRREVAPGRYERTDAQHSWNWETRFSGYYFLNLGRHSEHHRIASRPYEALEPAKGQPELPGALMAMYLAALVPPVWFALMNPRVAAVRAAQAAGVTLPAPAVAPARERAERFVGHWGGWLMLAALIGAGLVNSVWGFKEGAMFLIALGLVALLGREVLIAATAKVGSPPPAP